MSPIQINRHKIPPTMNVEDIRRQLDELQLIKCSLHPGEHILFPEDSGWEDALQAYSAIGDSIVSNFELEQPASFEIKVDGLRIWFKVVYSLKNGFDMISVKGENISRTEQERWQNLIKAKREEVADTEYPVYQTLSLYLLPLSHEGHSPESHSQGPHSSSTANHETIAPEIHHVLFTSHHLRSPKKRKSLQGWSSSLSLSGFAKVGYPGVIYAQGGKANVEEFVENVKGMQWLALKVRFMEPLPLDIRSEGGELNGWSEFQKVGEVVEEMRRIGREEYVVEMGIGSAGTEVSPQSSRPNII